MVFFGLYGAKKRGNTTSRVPPSSRDPSHFPRFAVEACDSFTRSNCTQRLFLGNRLRFLCGNDTVAVAMRFAMKNDQICFSLRKFLAISPAIQKIASDCGCDAVVHSGPTARAGSGGGERGTHIGADTGTYTQMLHLPFSDLPLKSARYTPEKRDRHQFWY